tara:strand:+ start:333 stop:1289 length:957 start_codon:yes stop_codon:yes gene_type:complete
MKKYLFIIMFVFISCEMEEIPVSPHNPGDIQINQIELSNDYRHQVFYDLGSNSIISDNLKTDWDLGFESSTQGYHVILNSSTYSSLSYIENISFNDNIDPTGLIWSWDNPNGDLDSSAFGDSRNVSGFYVFDRGFDLNGTPRGFKKILIDSITNEFYQISFSNLDNSEYNSFKLYKDPSVNFTCFSFESNQIVDIEPSYNDWDLLFSQYTHLYNDTTTPAYLVTGVCSNLDVLVAKDTSYEFNEINYSMINEFSFNDDRDAIGFDWKEYNFNAGSYTINSNTNYIIMDKQQKYFKLRFIDFYNSDGDKGYPTFEIQEL